MSIPLLQGWEAIPMDPSVLEQQPWRSLRQQAEDSALIRECQKERLCNICGKSLTRHIGPDIYRERKKYGNTVQIYIVRESYRMCRESQGWEAIPMDPSVLEQQPWRSLRQQAEDSALIRECQKERLCNICGKSLTGHIGPDIYRERKKYGNTVQIYIVRESYRMCRESQGWEAIPMDPSVLEQQPWRSLRQQAEDSALIRECQKERLCNICGKSLTGHIGPDIYRERKKYGNTVQIYIVRESYRMCRESQGWEAIPMDPSVLEQQPWRSLRQQAEDSALIRECQKERLCNICGKSLTGHIGPDIYRERKKYGNTVQIYIVRESYRMCRESQGLAHAGYAAFVQN
nr:uncharacterized protein LOC119715167 isoform X2 [Anas platyrhynchos]